MYFSYRKIKPQGRPRVNLCALNKTICLGLSVCLHYAKIICSLEDRANPPSHLAHKPRLRTGEDTGRAPRGGAPSPIEELIITSQLLSYRRKTSPNKPSRGGDMDTPGRRKSASSPQQPEDSRDAEVKTTQANCSQGEVPKKHR